MIQEEDCKVRAPNPVDDQFIRADVDWRHPTPEQSTSLLPATLKVVGGIARLLNLLRSPSLNAQALKAYDSYYDKCMSDLPDRHQVNAKGYLDPRELHPILYLQNARLALHRHNLNPMCPADARLEAIDSCVSAARDTTTFLYRCMPQSLHDFNFSVSESSRAEKDALVSSVSSFFCTHIWRCALFLCLRFDFASALVCVRVSSILDDARPINRACGRYLEFFLKELAIKWNDQIRLDEDEQMIAYVSGDLQGNFEQSWIWQESKGGVHMGSPLRSSDPTETSNLPDSQANGAVQFNTKDGADAWSGWDNIIRLLESYQQKTAGTVSPRQSVQTVPSPPIKSEARTHTQSPTPGSGQSASNRMSIRDLI